MIVFCEPLAKQKQNRCTDSVRIKYPLLLLFCYTYLMKTFKRIALVSIVWFIVWAFFIFVMQEQGIDYIHNYLFSCIYFAFAIGFIYTFLGSHIRAHANNFSLKELGIASGSLVVSIILYELMNRFVIPDSYDSLRPTLDYIFRLDNSFLVTKAFEIMFQQAFFIVSIDYLFKNGLSKNSDVFLFGLYSFIIHIPILFILDVKLATIILLSSFLAGLLFSYCIIRLKNGFVWSYVAHYSFYVLLGVVYWLSATHALALGFN